MGYVVTTLDRRSSPDQPPGAATTTLATPPGTNFSGNALAALVIGGWVKEIDRDQVDRVLDGHDPFDDADMLDEKSHH